MEGRYSKSKCFEPDNTLIVMCVLYILILDLGKKTEKIIGRTAFCGGNRPAWQACQGRQALFEFFKLK